MTEVPGRLVATIAGNMTPGVFELLPEKGGQTAMRFRCPCGCGEERTVQTQPEEPRKGSRVWKWNGNRRAPTVTPSISCATGCRWHGYLIGGVWKGC